MNASSTRSFILKGVILILFSLYVILVFGQPRWQMSTTLIMPDKTSPQASLRYFKGTVIEKSVLLQWSLIKENNLSSIIVEKRSSDDQFGSIAQFWINFDGNKTTDFHFKDRDGNNATQYYRLKLIDDNGRAEYSSVIIVKSETGNDKERNTPSFNTSTEDDSEEVWVSARPFVMIVRMI